MNKVSLLAASAALLLSAAGVAVHVAAACPDGDKKPKVACPDGDKKPKVACPDGDKKPKLGRAAALA